MISYSPLLEFLSDMGISHLEASRRIGQHPTFLYQVFSGNRNLSFAHLNAICNTFDLPISQVIHHEKDEKDEEAC